MLGDAFNSKYWNGILSESKSLGNERSGFCWGWLWNLSFEWKFRRALDWSVNSVCRMTVLYTFPIMLCVEDPLDFVKDCTAVYFICTLDDLTEGKRSITEMLAKLKFGIFLQAFDKEHTQRMSEEEH